MSHVRNALLSLAAIAPMAAHSFDARVAAAQKPPKAVSYPTVAEFLAGGIVDESGGPYFNGVDGVSSSRVSGNGSTNGWVWDLAASRTRTPRSLVYDLTDPIQGPPQGVITVHDTHGQIYDLSNMAVGEVKYVRASFHIFINRSEYVLRFGQTPGDGSSALEVTRLSAGQFHVVTGEQGDLARYLAGNGPGEVVLGIYHVPVDLWLTNQ